MLNMKTKLAPPGFIFEVLVCVQYHTYLNTVFHILSESWTFASSVHRTLFSKEKEFIAKLSGCQFSLQLHAVQFSCVFPVFVAVSGFGVDCINPLSGNADLEVADASLN